MPARLTPEQAAAVVALAVRAPSIHNTQPWRFVLRDGALELHADRSRALPATDPDGRQLLLSCGAALFGARLGLRTLGVQDEVELLPDDGGEQLLARLRPGPKAMCSAEEVSLVQATARRRSLRHGYAEGSVPAGVLAAARRAAASERAVLLLLHDAERTQAVAELVAAADRAQAALPEAVRELRRWTLRGRLDGDGVPEDAWPPRPPPRAPNRLAGRDFSGLGARARVLSSAAAPVVGAVVTGGDGRADWLTAGQATYRVLLTAAAAGVQASLHSQPFGLLALRGLLREELPGGGEPQMLLQFGLPTTRDRDRAPTPRRLPSSVLEVVGSTA